MTCLLDNDCPWLWRYKQWFGIVVETCMSCGGGVPFLEFFGGLFHVGIDCEDMISGMVFLAKSCISSRLEVPSLKFIWEQMKDYGRLGEDVSNHYILLSFGSRLGFDNDGMVLKVMMGWKIGWDDNDGMMLKIN